MLHAFLALAYLHDSFLNPGFCTPAQKVAIAFHEYHSTALLKQKLLSVSNNSAADSAADIDSLWISSSLIAIAAYCTLDARDPYSAWPLRDDDPGYLSWLLMCHGKYHNGAMDLSPTETLVICQRKIQPPTPTGFEPIPENTLPEAFYALLELDQQSNVHNNPYFGPASILAQTLPLEPRENNILSFLGFASQSTGMLDLLERKDERALLLRAYWYAKLAAHPSWWMHRRAVLEGPAICIYLDKHTADDRIIQLLEYPKAVFATLIESREST
jgi:hypothetical protein